MTLHAHPGGEAKVVAFRRPCDDAVGRNRHLAARAISQRLRSLLSKADAKRYGVSDLCVGELYVWFSDSPEGVYFRVEGIGAKAPLMTGYLDPPRRGNYPAQNLHIMSWRWRGWEWRLFEKVRPSA